MYPCRQINNYNTIHISLKNIIYCSTAQYLQHIDWIQSGWGTSALKAEETQIWSTSIHSTQCKSHTESLFYMNWKCFSVLMLIRWELIYSPAFNIITHNDVTGLVNWYESRFTDDSLMLNNREAVWTTELHNIQYMMLLSSTNVMSDCGFQ